MGLKVAGLVKDVYHLTHGGKPREGRCCDAAIGAVETPRGAPPTENQERHGKRPESRGSQMGPKP